MKIEIEVPNYSSEYGIQLNWDQDFSIRVTVSGDDVIIQANQAGLCTLARHLLTLAQQQVPVGHHVHYDAASSLEDESSGLVVVKI
jgi:hypothetical protein